MSNKVCQAHKTALACITKISSINAINGQSSLLMLFIYTY